MCVWLRHSTLLLTVNCVCMCARTHVCVCVCVCVCRVVWESEVPQGVLGDEEGVWWGDLLEDCLPVSLAPSILLTLTPSGLSVSLLGAVQETDCNKPPQRAEVTGVSITGHLRFILVWSMSTLLLMILLFLYWHSFPSLKDELSCLHDHRSCFGSHLYASIRPTVAKSSFLLPGNTSQMLETHPVLGRYIYFLPNKCFLYFLWRHLKVMARGFFFFFTFALPHYMFFAPLQWFFLQVSS